MEEKCVNKIIISNEFVENLGRTCFVIEIGLLCIRVHNYNILIFVYR